MLSYDLLIASVVSGSLGIDISHHDGNVSSLVVLVDSRQSAVGLFFFFFFFFTSALLSFVWGIALNNIHVDHRFLGLEGGLENP